MSDFLTLIRSNVETYDLEEPRNKHPALGFSWAETGTAMAFAHLLGQEFYYPYQC